MQVALPIRELGLFGTIAREIILRGGTAGALAARFSGHQKIKVSPPDEIGTLPAFSQAEVAAADFESFFHLFPDYLVKDALRDKEVLDLGSGYGGRTVEFKLCGAKRVCGIEPFANVVA